MNTLIAVPVFNERPYVARVLNRLREIHPHILFVDDCSTDGTSEILARQTGIAVIRHATNKGYGQAIIDAVNRVKPAGVKGIYLRRAVLTSTMSPGIRLDLSTGANA